MLKRESASVDRKYLRMPLFRVRVPLFGKEGLGEICGVRSNLFNFSELPFGKGVGLRPFGLTETMLFGGRRKPRSID